MSATAAMDDPPAPSAPTDIRDYFIRISARAVPDLRRVAGIDASDLLALIQNGHWRSLRERSTNSSGAWAVTEQVRVDLAQTARDLHLLVFDPEREGLFVAYAKVDPRAERLTILRVVTAQQYEQMRWQLLPIDVCRALCASTVSCAQRLDRILRDALGDRDPMRMPILLSLQNDKRPVWVECIEHDRTERRMGILPFDLKKLAPEQLTDLQPFWDWMRSTRDNEDALVDRSHLAAVRLVAYNDPFEIVVPVAAGAT
jgi:hypothetical protein